MSRVRLLLVGACCAIVAVTIVLALRIPASPRLPTANPPTTHRGVDTIENPVSAPPATARRPRATTNETGSDPVVDTSRMTSVASIDDNDVPRIPLELAPGLPEGVLRAFRRISTAIQKLDTRVRSGGATKKERAHHAQLSAVAALIRQNRYWYIGPRQLRPDIPPANAMVGYLQCSVGDDDVAVFELLQSEFPGSYELPPYHSGMTDKERREAMLEEARAGAKR